MEEFEVFSVKLVLSDDQCMSVCVCFRRMVLVRGQEQHHERVPDARHELGSHGQCICILQHDHLKVVIERC
jgi:hypothetical protein